MRCSVRRCLVTLVAIGFLWLFVTLRVPEEIEEDQDVMTIKGQVAAPALGVGLVGQGGSQSPAPSHPRAGSSGGR